MIEGGQEERREGGREGKREGVKDGEWQDVGEEMTERRGCQGYNYEVMDPWGNASCIGPKHLTPLTPRQPH